MTRSDTMQARRFAGRDAELQHIARAFQEHRVVTVSGMPGIGKTALADQVAGQIAAGTYRCLEVRLAEGAGLLEAVDAELRRHDVPAFTRYLAEPGLDAGEKLQMLFSVLRRDLFLLLIDDAHVLGFQQATELTRQLARHLGNSRALVTSRVRLPATGESQVDITLGGLDLDASVEVLTGERRPPAEEDREALEGLAGDLSGHPLCLKLLASHMRERHLSPSRLREQAESWKGPLRPALLESIYGALGLADRRLLAILGLFRGAAPVEALRVLAGPDAVEQAGQAADRFLVERAPGGGFSVHPLLGELFSGRLPADEQRRLRLEIGNWFEARARAVNPPEVELLLEAYHQAVACGDGDEVYRLGLELIGPLQERCRHEELGLMLDRILGSIHEPHISVIVAKARHCRDRGGPHEARQLLRDFSYRKEPEEQLALLVEEGQLDQDAGRFERASKRYYSALELARRLRRRPIQASILTRIATICKDQGEYTRAAGLYEQAMALHEALGLESERAFALHNLAKIHYYHGDLERAVACHLEALEIWEKRGERLNALLSRNGIANVLRDRGMLSQAAETYERNLAEYRELANPFGEGYTLMNLADLRMRQGELRWAQMMLVESLSLAESIGNRLGEAMALDKLGDLRRMAGRYQEARDFYERSLAIKRETRSSYGEAITLNCLGDLARESGDYARAHDFYEQALRRARSMRDREGVARALEGKAIILCDRGELAAARAQFDEALELRREMDEKRGIGRVLTQLGRISGDAGDSARARELFQEGLELFRKLDNRQEMQRTLGCLAQLQANLGRFEEARALARESLDLATEIEDLKGEAIAMTQLGQLALFEGELAEAERLFLAALELREVLGDVRGVVATEEPLALTLMEAGRFEEARSVLSRTVAVADEAGFPKLALLARAHLTLLDLKTNRLDAAERGLGGLLDRAADTGFSEGTAYLRRLHGFLLYRRGRTAEAAEALREAHDLYRKLSLGRERGRIEQELDDLGKEKLLARLDRRRSMQENARRLDSELLGSGGRTVTVVAVDLGGVARPLPDAIREDRRTTFRPGDSTLERLLEELGGTPVRIASGALLASFERPEPALRFCRLACEAPEADGGGGKRRRAGLYSGPAIQVGPELFGEPFELAARFHGLAAPGEVLFPAELLGAVDPVPPGVVEAPPQRVRGRRDPLPMVRLPA